MELIHGGDWAGQEERLGNRSIRDFSANVSPLGVPDGVREAICRAAGKIDRYPDPLCRKLVQKLSEELSCPEEWIVCGNGAADLIYRLFQAEKPKKVLLTAPAFAEYEQAAGLVGSRIYFYELKEEDQFQIQEDILGQITPDTDLVFLCEPNNPTGQCTKHSLLTAILERCRECSALLVLDECFLEFLPDRKERTLLPYLGQYPNLVILRAFTKLYAMAGVRLGYCVCSDGKRTAVGSVASGTGSRSRRTFGAGICRPGEKTGGTTASDSGKGLAAGRIYSLGGKSQLSVVSQSRCDAWKKNGRSRIPDAGLLQLS